MIKKFIICTVMTVFCDAAHAVIKYDPTQLDHFKQTGSCPGCDLSSTNIDVASGVSTPFNLQGANISHSMISISNETLSNFTDAIAIHTNFIGNCYSQSSFRNAVLIGAHFDDANLMYTDFTGANIKEANFTHADLYGSKGIDLTQGADFCDAIMPDGSKGPCK